MAIFLRDLSHEFFQCGLPSNSAYCQLSRTYNSQLNGLPLLQFRNLGSVYWNTYSQTVAPLSDSGLHGTTSVYTKYIRGIVGVST